MDHAPKRRPGRPRQALDEGAILEVAWSAFLEHGLDGASMVAIARSAGVSRLTLYRRYPSKAALFDAAMQAHVQGLDLPRRLAGDAPLADVLVDYGVQLMTFLTSDQLIELQARLMGQIRARPDLARAFFESGPGGARDDLADLLRTRGPEAGLAIDDPLEAAEALMGLWIGLKVLKVEMGLDIEEVRASIPRHVRRMVALALRAWAAPSSS